MELPTMSAQKINFSLHAPQMTTKELYKRFMNLCQRWPKDEMKVGRDYAETFRVQLMEYFPHSDLGQVKEPQKVEAMLEPLERMANNIYYNENPLKRSSSTGLDTEACREVVSNEGLRIIQQQEEASLFKRLKNTLNMQFVESKANQKIGQIDGK